MSACSGWHKFVVEKRREGISMAQAGELWEAFADEDKVQYTEDMAKVKATIPKHKVELQTQQFMLDGLRASTPLGLGDHIWQAVVVFF